ncbi:MAG: DUF1566 domain-containing protein [Spirochaetaceae bacterium]|nr:DUF1566 domain-containing protein [Spirochaetaceae bacterium]
MKNKLFLFVYLFMLVVIISCGGGGGGGGVVAFQNNSQMHNGADAGGWGSGNQTGGGFGGGAIQSSNLLISQMAALPDIHKVEIHLTINGVPQEVIVADATTTTDVLPKISVGDIVSGYAEIFLPDNEIRTAQLDETEIALSNTLKFKVPYYYSACGLDGTPLVFDEIYYAGSGIDLSAYAVDPNTGESIAGWYCVQDGTTHYGSYVTGVRGDITLNAVEDTGAITATVATSTLYAEQSNPLGDQGQTTITITGATGTPTVATVNPSQASLLTFGTPMPDANDASKYTVSVAIASDTDTDNFNKVWFSDSTNVFIQATDPSGATSNPLSLTLCNMYGYQLMQSDGTLDSSATVLEGTTLSFDTAKTTVGTDVSGREIVAFKNASGNVVLCEKTNPGPTSITFNSTNFNKRLVSLTAVPVFTYTVKDANDNNLTQTGTQADPYILKFNGTAAEKGLHVSVPTGEFVGLINTTFDTSNVLSRSLGSSPYNNPGIGIMNTLTIAEIPSTPVKVTLADSGTGATREFYVKIQPPIIGTKPAPDTVGDIVFKDGSAMTPTQFSALSSAEQNTKKADVIAVFFDATNKLGIALNESTPLVWATGSIGINCNFGTSNTDGSGNWSVIGLQDPTGTAAQYPAFNYCNNYSPSDTGGWYLPAIDELWTLSNSSTLTTVNAALSQISGSTVTGYYWSSSQYSDTDSGAWAVWSDWPSKASFNKDDTANNYKARPIKKFD